jgi:hypothetical protein
LEGLPVAEEEAAFYRLRFLTKDETMQNGSPTDAGTGTVPMQQNGINVELPSRSATILVIPLQ